MYCTSVCTKYFVCDCRECTVHTNYSGSRLLPRHVDDLWIGGEENNPKPLSANYRKVTCDSIQFMFVCSSIRSSVTRMGVDEYTRVEADMTCIFAVYRCIYLQKYRYV